MSFLFLFHGLEIKTGWIQHGMIQDCTEGFSWQDLSDFKGKLATQETAMKPVSRRAQLSVLQLFK